MKWRRSVNIDDVEAMAKDCGPEVSTSTPGLRSGMSTDRQSETGKNLLLGFTPQAQPIVYFFPARNRTPVERRRAIHAVSTIMRSRIKTDRTGVHDRESKRSYDRGPNVSLAFGHRCMTITNVAVRSWCSSISLGRRKDHRPVSQ
jgi:hypothetical protein